MATEKRKRKFNLTKAKVNRPNTRHGKMEMPYTALNKYAKMAEGGSVAKKLSPFQAAFAAARKEKGPGATFTYNGKTYTTDRADDKPKASSSPNRMRLDTSEKAVTARAREELKPTPKAPPNSLARKPAPAGIAKDAAPDSRLSGVKSTFAAGVSEKPKSYRELSPSERMGKLAPSAPQRERDQKAANAARKSVGLPEKKIGPGWAKGGAVTRGDGCVKKGHTKGRYI